MKKLLSLFVAIAMVAGLSAMAWGAPAKFVWYIPAPHPYFDTVKVGVEAFAKEYNIPVKQQVGPDWNMDSENTGVLALAAQGYTYFSIYPSDASAANGLYDEVVKKGGKVVNFGASTFEPTPASFAVRTDVKDAAKVADGLLIAEHIEVERFHRGTQGRQFLRGQRAIGRADLRVLLERELILHVVGHEVQLEVGGQGCLEFQSVQS